MKNINNILNIIYICTADKGPSGGAKTIYNHSELINKLKIKGLSSQILHLKKRKTSKWNNSIKKVFKFNNRDYHGWTVKDIAVDDNFKSKWFKNNVLNKNDLIFNKKKDFVIFPEIFAHFAENLCKKKKMPYAIFVQNGYSLAPTNNYNLLNSVYKKAKFILSYSDDISKCVELAFPFCKNKILRTNISIDIKKFNFKTKKTNLITYMPRKLPIHSDNLNFFLRKKLPKNWKIKSIHNLTEENVYKYLLKSKIFLSFSSMEGLGMPPIEAAIAGNKVIGYHGQGGKRYWKEPIFTTINPGDINNFVFKVIKNINKKKLLNKLKSQRKKIIKDFSLKQESIYVINMIKKIRKLI